MKVLGLIPARGSSKGVPRKNIKLLCGKPLLAYTAEAALTAESLTRVVLSTEDEEIAEIGKKCGLDVPFLRPIELAQDNTPSLPVVQHAVQMLEETGEKYDAVCLLQPTNPLRRRIDINRCLELLARSDADSVVSVRPVPHEYNPHWVYWRRADKSIVLTTGENAPIARRQDLPLAFHRDGSIYAVRRDVLMRENSLYGARVIGYEIDSQFSCNIDTEQDWQEIEARLATTRTQAGDDKFGV